MQMINQSHVNIAIGGIRMKNAANEAKKIATICYRINQRNQQGLAMVVHTAEIIRVLVFV